MENEYVDASNRGPGEGSSDRSCIRASGEVIAYANQISASLSIDHQQRPTTWNGCGSNLCAEKAPD